MRHLLIIKNGLLQFKRILHPNAILPIRYNEKSVSSEIMYNILGFFIVYMLSFIAGALVFSILHYPLGFPSVLATFVSGLFFGYLYQRHKNLLGVSLVHFITGKFFFAFYYAMMGADMVGWDHHEVISRAKINRADSLLIESLFEQIF